VDGRKRFRSTAEFDGRSEDPALRLAGRDKADSVKVYLAVDTLASRGQT